MKAVHTVFHRQIPRAALALLASIFVIACANSVSDAQEGAHRLTAGPAEVRGAIPPAELVWQHVGRVYINPGTGKAVYAGYVVHINGIDTSLFNGAPSEGSAFFTFKTDVLTLTPLPNNGDVALTFVSPGTFTVYYNPSPAGNWSAPNSFSNGQLIATFARTVSLFPQIGPIGLHNLSEVLQSSQPFVFEGQVYDFERMTPHGITFAQFFSTKALTGTTAYPAAFAAVGTTIAVGGHLLEPGQEKK